MQAFSSLADGAVIRSWIISAVPADVVERSLVLGMTTAEKPKKKSLLTYSRSAPWPAAKLISSSNTGRVRPRSRDRTVCFAVFFDPGMCMMDFFLFSFRFSYLPLEAMFCFLIFLCFSHLAYHVRVREKLMYNENEYKMNSLEE